MTIRTFSPGDAGLPEQGILLGRGGGFTWAYSDLILLPNDNIRLLRYATPGGPIPHDHKSVVLVDLTPQQPQVPGFIQQLHDMDFHGMVSPTPSSNLIRYVVLIEPGPRIHFVEWGHVQERSLSPNLLELVRRMRQFVVEAFGQAYGP